MSAFGYGTGSDRVPDMNLALDDRLDAVCIRDQIVEQEQLRLRHLTVLGQTDSTNSAIQRLSPGRQHAHAIVAECQTGGRGRRQRYWHSPAGGNIYLSLGWRFEREDAGLSSLPLVVAISVCGALERTGLTGHGIKWPNDILVNGEKLAGILVEMQSNGTGPALAVIGIGLNVRMPEPTEKEAASVIDRPWTDLVTQLDAGHAGINRNWVISLLLEELLSALQRFEKGGFREFRSSWEDLDLLRGRRVELKVSGRSLLGIARGVDEIGGLLMEIEGTGLQVFHSGEASFHHG